MDIWSIQMSAAPCLPLTCNYLYLHLLYLYIPVVSKDKVSLFLMFKLIFWLFSYSILVLHLHLFPFIWALVLVMYKLTRLSSKNKNLPSTSPPLPLLHSSAESLEAIVCPYCLILHFLLTQSSRLAYISIAPLKFLWQSSPVISILLNAKGISGVPLMLLLLTIFWDSPCLVCFFMFLFHFVWFQCLFLLLFSAVLFILHLCDLFFWPSP